MYTLSPTGARRGGRRLTAGSLRACLGVAVLVAVGATMARPAAAQQSADEHARQLALKTIQTYHKAQTARVKWKVRVQAAMGAMRLNVSGTGEMAYQKPNRYFFVASQGEQSLRVVCDGTHFFVEEPASKLVVRGPAPDSLAQLSKLVSSSPYMVTDFSFAELIFIPLKTGEASAEDVRKATAGVPSGSEWLAKLTSPKGSVPITLILQPEGEELSVPLVLWIDPDTALVSQAALDINAETLQAMAKQEGSGSPEGTPEMSLAVAVTVTYQAIDQPLDDAVFQYRPPEGYERTDAASVSEAIEVIRKKLAAIAAQSSDEGEAEQGQHGAGLRGKQPPDFTARTLDGKPVRLSSLRGKPIVLDFWATWCPPCSAELPILDELYKALRAQGLQVVAVSLDRELDRLREFLDEKPLSFTVWWLDRTSGDYDAVIKAYGIQAIPRTLYINRQFIVKEDTIGLHPRDAIIKAIGALGIDVTAAK